MKKFKKMATLGLAAMMAVSAINVSAYEDDTLKGRNNLLEMGMDSDLINVMSDTELSKYANASLISKENTYYNYIAEIEYNYNTGEETVVNVTSMEVSETEAKSLAEEENKLAELTPEERINTLRGNDTMTLNDGYNSSTHYLVSATLQLEAWTTYTTGNQYRISSRFEWLSYPSECMQDMLALSNDTNLTQVQNSSYFVAKADVYKKTTSGATTFEYTEVLSEGYDDYYTQDLTGVGYLYSIPYQTYNGTSYYWYQYEGLKGYLAYDVIANSSGTFAILGSYGHQYKSITWSPSVSVSYPAGISFSAWPVASSKIKTCSTMCNFNK